ncbi:DNA polymerase III subunit delta [Parasphingopyxis algicola]|uniref:DNA polymerase III subunit delta n=1 Tax=Parasphingopyxis algicola TaxID=2026624 RepID=UPI0015A4BB52|nr:DNA polymerase III subunit delta [Parasphingopyxis algicola]QLC25650.1 DNA polymerase III subunit delta [Parasphingopyxis algicola]
MKANRGQIARALSAPGDDVRFYLLYGPDRSGSEALAALLGKAMGDEAERIDFSGPELKADPAKLADEAAAISLFGGARYIRIDPAGDEIFAAVEALIEAEKAGNPVVAVAGALRATNKLVKLAFGSDVAMACASYAPEGRDADRLVIEMGQEAGLQIAPDIAQRLARGCHGDRAILASELAKLALYLDAAPDRPRRIEHDALDALAANADEGDLSRLANVVLSGDLPALDRELTQLASEGLVGIPLLRAVLRRLLLLAKLRAEVEQGNSAQSVIAKAGRAIFWKDKPVITDQVERWRSDALAIAINRASDAERTLKSSGGPGMVAADEELFAIARKARTLR